MRQVSIQDDGKRFCLDVGWDPEEYILFDAYTDWEEMVVVIQTYDKGYPGHFRLENVEEIKALRDFLTDNINRFENDPCPQCNEWHCRCYS